MTIPARHFPSDLSAAVETLYSVAPDAVPHKPDRLPLPGVPIGNAQGTLSSSSSAALIGFMADMGGSSRDGQLMRRALAPTRPT